MMRFSSLCVLSSLARRCKHHELYARLVEAAVILSSHCRTTETRLSSSGGRCSDTYSPPLIGRVLQTFTQLKHRPLL